MRRTWKWFSAITLSCLLLLTGCSSDAQPNTNETTNKPKELTPIEVLEKASDNLGKNVTYEVNQNQKLEIDTNGTKIIEESTTTMTMNMANENYHAKGTMTASGQTIPVEIYYENNTLYKLLEDNSWVKITYFEDMGSQQDPSALLKELAKLVEKLGGNALPKGISVNKKDNHYLVEINYKETEQSEKFENEIKNEIVEELKASGDAFAGQLTADKIQFEKNIVKIHIDDQNFQSTKMEHEIILGFDIENIKVKTDVITTLNLKGEYNGTIEVPEEVKSKAKSM